MYDWQTLGAITRHGGEGVLLTFDDGPGRALPAILDVLADARAHALFFWQGRLLQRGRHPVERVLAEGHSVGSHSLRHRLLPRLAPAEQYHDIDASLAILQARGCKPIRWFRPPFGRTNTHTLTAARSLGLTTVLWDVAGWDWDLAGDPAAIAQNVVEHVRPGSIVLLHELPQTVQALPAILAGLERRGLRLDGPEVLEQVAGTLELR